jgi:hypothetical protein
MPTTDIDVAVSNGAHTQATEGPSQAAAAIVRLINSSPRSPRVEEIEAIISKTISPSLYLREEPALARKYRELMERGDDANDRAVDTDGACEADLVQLAGGGWARKADLDECDDCTDEASKLAYAVWSTPPRSIDDIYTRAEIARYWHQGEETWLEGQKPEECDDWGDRAVAELIHAVLELGAGKPPATGNSISHMADDWWRTLTAERAMHAGHKREHEQRKALAQTTLPAEMLARIDAEAQTAYDATTEATLKVWRAGAKTWADVVLFAELARYWQWDPEDPELDGEFKTWLKIDEIGLDMQSLAQLVNAVLTVGKEGRP